MFQSGLFRFVLVYDVVYVNTITEVEARGKNVMLVVVAVIVLQHLNERWTDTFD